MTCICSDFGISTVYIKVLSVSDTIPLIGGWPVIVIVTVLLIIVQVPELMVFVEPVVMVSVSV